MIRIGIIGCGRILAAHLEATDFALSQLDWLRAIENGTQPECSGPEGLRDLACGYAVVESDHAD